MEGEHYVKTGDGHITYPEGMNSENSGWAMNIGWLLGNEFLSYVWEGTDLDIWEQTKAFNEASRMSPAVGFVYEVADVATEYAACSSIKTEYQRALETGSMELERLDEMNQQLELAGLQEIIEEKQKQLDQYLAGRN
ncbi:MAG TPA: DUF3502 domain-containing protein [Candidatus Mediterraneibacter cottocaccae]|nr:DUF3502 domain-containing protein [Candidatus Mediterraneibacter cottocaccae]